MVRIAVCDDQQEYTLQISSLLDQWENVPEPIVLECFNNGDALLEAHAQNPFDIIFLDIIMPGLNGMDVARELRSGDRNVRIVFLTSSTEYAIESYSVKASNYLLKPVQADKLFECISELSNDIKNSARYLLIKNNGIHQRVPVSQIEYVEAQNKYVHFVLTDGRTLKSSDTFSHCHDMLTNEHNFYRCHRSYIVNLYCLDSFTTSELVTHSGHRIPIARSCQKEFESVYFSVMFETAGDN